MPATVIVGAQWGDEGKGKATDQLGSRVDHVVKFNGGNNAGHTGANSARQASRSGPGRPRATP